MSPDLRGWLLVLVWSPVIWAACAIAWQTAANTLARLDD